ncbi:FHA domain-containing protein [Actinomycetaceae bacterium TAE3-ERU4]|nr:FHA domain-containing protein [Actinomycetaceae bacterium TAE3-ERU4]
MNNELLFTVFRFSYLILLWLMVLVALTVLRRDIFGTMVTPRGRGRAARKAEHNRQKTASKPAKAESSSAVLPGMPGSFPVPEAEGPLRLIVTGGPLAGTSLPLGSAPVVIGRSPSCTLVLDDNYASGRHARLFPDKHSWWLEDLDSTNGTFMDDERVVQARPLQPGIRFRVGQTTMEIGR